MTYSTFNSLGYGGGGGSGAGPGDSAKAASFSERRREGIQTRKLSGGKFSCIPNEIYPWYWRKTGRLKGEDGWKALGPIGGDVDSLTWEALIQSDFEGLCRCVRDTNLPYGPVNSVTRIDYCWSDFFSDRTDRSVIVDDHDGPVFVVPPKLRRQSRLEGKDGYGVPNKVVVGLPNPCSMASPVPCSVARNLTKSSKYVRRDQVKNLVGAEKEPAGSMFYPIRYANRDPATSIFQGDGFPDNTDSTPNRVVGNPSLKVPYLKKVKELRDEQRKKTPMSGLGEVDRPNDVIMLHSMYIGLTAVALGGIGFFVYRSTIA